MKKMLVLMSFLAVFTTMIFAGGRTCNVSGSSNAYVELLHTNAQSGGNGQVCTEVRVVNLEKKISSVNVIVYCYDAWGNPVDAKSFTLVSGVKIWACFNVEPNKAYTFEVRDATCK